MLLFHLNYLHKTVDWLEIDPAIPAKAGFGCPATGCDYVRRHISAVETRLLGSDILYVSWVLLGSIPGNWESGLRSPSEPKADRNYI